MKLFQLDETSHATEAHSSSPSASYLRSLLQAARGENGVESWSRQAEALEKLRSLGQIAAPYLELAESHLAL